MLFHSECGSMLQSERKMYAPNHSELKIIDILSVSLVQLAPRYFASGHAFVILSREIRCAALSLIFLYNNCYYY